SIQSASVWRSRECVRITPSPCPHIRPQGLRTHSASLRAARKNRSPAHSQVGPIKVTDASGGAIVTSVRTCRSVAIALALGVFGALAALGQYTNATIAGTVYDTGGAVVAGANVTALNPNTGYKKSMMTAEDGTFLLPAMPVGQ